MRARGSPKKRTSTGHRTRVGRERRARTQQRIVAAALRVFAEKGPDAAVIDDFIREAGVARGTFYNYFTRTGDLLVAVTQALEDDLIQSINAEMSLLRDPVSRVATGLRLWLAWARDNPVGCAFIVRSRFRGPLVEHQLTADLRDGLDAGAFDFPDVRIARDLVVGSVLEAMHRLLTPPVPRNYADGIVRMILAGLGLDGSVTEEALKWPVPRLQRPVQSVG